MRKNLMLLISGVLIIILLTSTIYLHFANAGAQKYVRAADYYGKLSIDTRDVAGLSGNLNDIHNHADFRVVVNGKVISFFDPALNVSNAFIHLHLDNREDGDKVMHIENTGITLSHLFNGMAMKLSTNCIKVYYDTYCEEDGKRLAVLVNGKVAPEKDDYEPKDRDKVLIIYGDFTDEQALEESILVTDFAKRYSN